MTTSPAETNWSGNYAFRAAKIHHPASLDELARLVAQARHIRALGSRHSFTAIADADELVALDRLPGDISVDHKSGRVTLPGHVTYAELAAVLNREGMALPSLASLPHISVAGAVATASHGSGNRTGNLATAVVELDLLDSAGDLTRWHRGDDDFDGIVVGLGAVGIVTRLTLAVEPFYEMSQRVFEDLDWDSLFEHFDEITATGDSVSIFHRFGDQIDQVWVKRRIAADSGGDDEPEELFGAHAATEDRHPVLGGDPVNCTVQLGRPGAWSERLPHFRSGFTPSSGEEIQSEFFVAREDAVAAVQAVRELAPVIAPLLLVCEVRTIAADSLWLSPQYERPTVGIHFTWRRRQTEVQRVVIDIQATLAPFAARPHWAKLFAATSSTIAPLYPRMEDFRRLRERLDPRDAFANDWLRERVLNAA
jgi:xylitol oxidase